MNYYSQKSGHQFHTFNTTKTIIYYIFFSPLLFTQIGFANTLHHNNWQLNVSFVTDMWTSLITCYPFISFTSQKKKIQSSFFYLEKFRNNLFFFNQSLIDYLLKNRHDLFVGFKKGLHDLDGLISHLLSRQRTCKHSTHD